MAVKQIVSDGIGFDAGVIGWLLTEGLGNFTSGGGGGGSSVLTIPTNYQDRG